MSEITLLLERATRGEQGAANELMPMIYDRLRSIAHRAIALDSSGRTLATTGLVHEAYIALFGGDVQMSWRDRAQFYTYAATSMRRILIDRARSRMADKRDNSAGRQNLTAGDLCVADDSVDLLAMDQVLKQLALHHPRLVQVVELRFFAGLSVEDVAASLNIDPRSVKRDWQKARAYINRALERVE